MFSKIIVHRVGNKINGEALRISAQELEVEEGMKESLTDFFLKGFKSDEQFQFYSDTYLNQNPIYQSVKQIFEDPSEFLSESETRRKN